MDSEAYVPLRLHEAMRSSDLNEAVIDAVITYLEEQAACEHDADEALRYFISNAKLTWRNKILLTDRDNSLSIRELGINKSVPHAERIIGITRAPLCSDQE